MNRAAVTIGIMAIAIVALLLLLLRGCENNCPETTIVKKWTDTVYLTIYDVRPSITVKVPEAWRVVKKPKPAIVSPSPVQGESLVSVKAGASGYASAPFSACDETVVYTDTTEEANAYRAIIEDTLTGNRITGRRITFYDISPRITGHVEKTIPLKERVRLYLGLSVGFTASYTDKKISNINFGPEVFVTAPVGALVGYGFDARNNGHRLTFAWKIKLKK